MSHHSDLWIAAWKSKFVRAVLWFTSGLAVATVLIGVPTLHNAEAASWASAAGTVLAVVVALWIGLGTVNLTWKLRRDDQTARDAARMARRKALAAAVSEEIFEAEVRLYRIHRQRDDRRPAMLTRLYKDMAMLQVPLLHEVVSSNLDAFDDADAAAIGRTLASVMKCQRFAEPTAIGVDFITAAVVPQVAQGLQSQLDSALPKVSALRLRMVELADGPVPEMTPAQVIDRYLAQHGLD